MADFPPTHPGEVLGEGFLKPLAMSQYALAKALGVPEIRISEIVRGKRAITPDTALRLARYFGTSAEFWLACRRATIWSWRVTAWAPRSTPPFILGPLRTRPGLPVWTGPVAWREGRPARPGGHLDAAGRDRSADLMVPRHEKGPYSRKRCSREAKSMPAGIRDMGAPRISSISLRRIASAKSW
jgi:addiction module HigA family antidote